MTITKSVLVPLANGFEEIEAITIIDVLRRAKVEVITAGLQDGAVEASRKTRHLPDTSLDQVIHRTFDAIVLPGGQPGTNHLKEDDRVRDILLKHARMHKWIAAICAAPIVLHPLGLLSGKSVTSHPSVREQLTGTHYLEDRVVLDGTILTSRGPGTAMEFALKIVELLHGKQTVEEISPGLILKA